MGVPTTGGAVGSITINTSQLAAARAAVNAFATGVNTSLTGINAGANKAQAGIGSMAGSLRGLAGAFGLSLGVAGAVQLAKAGVAATQAATAFDRQTLAARNLAGSQGQLNELTAAYSKATGGAIDKASALSNITRLQATGFADSAEELERFVRGVRGASIAMGKTQDEIGQEVQLAISNRSFKRLDQIGLGIEETTARIDELRAANKGMSQDAAFQEAVLGLLETKFGALTTSVVGQATGVEQLARAWADLRLEMGKSAKGPADTIAGRIAARVDATAEVLRIERERWAQGKQMYGVNSIQGTIGGGAVNQFSDPVISPVRRGGTPVNQEARAAKLDWSRGITDLNRQTHAAIIDEETSFGQSRSKTVADYSKSVAREERDFGRARLRAELDQLDAIADVWKDASRRESKAAADLARSNSQARADSDERIADARKDSQKRLVELEEDYHKDREKAAEDHRDKLMDAAGRLDAEAVYRLQRDFAKQEKEAEESHKEQRDEINEALKEREEDERKSLEKSIRQANEAAQRQLEEARENDRLRLEEMKADFAKRKTQEDEDRAIRLGDRAADYAAQLVEMDAQHGLRLNQIRTNAIREREALQLAADDALVAAGAADAATMKRHEAREEAEEKLWDKFHKHITDSMTIPQAQPGGPIKAYARGGYVPTTGLAMLHAGEFVMPAPPRAAASGMNNSRSISIGNISPTIVLGDVGGRSDEYIMDLVEKGMIRALESQVGDN